MCEHYPVLTSKAARAMYDTLLSDPILVRFRAAVDELHGDNLERVVLFGSRARGMRTRIPITTWPSF